MPDLGEAYRDVRARVTLLLGGAGDDVATVHVSRFELIRAATGRHSPAQVSAYPWDGDARPARLVAGNFSARATDLEE